MADSSDWSLATWEGNRLQQHRDFLALPFREKLRVLEHLGEVASFFAERRKARGLAVRERGAGYQTAPDTTPAR